MISEIQRNTVLFLIKIFFDCWETLVKFKQIKAEEIVKIEELELKI